MTAGSGRWRPRAQQAASPERHLVAADIVGTVAFDPMLHGLGVLAGIVLIRTFLSFSLEVEIEGHWPWQHGQRRRDA